MLASVENEKQLWRDMKWILRIIVQCAWLLGKGDSTKKLVIEEFKSRKRKRK